MNTRRVICENELEIAGVTFRVLTKNIKNISMRASKTHGLTISVPLEVSWAKVTEFAIDNLHWAIRQQQRLEKMKAECETPYSPEERRRFMQCVQTLLPQCENRMNLKCSKVTVKLMKSRWGSCKASTRAISLNLALARKPEECLEYVIIHELAHIVHQNHSDKFWELVEHYCPDWRRIRRSLRD